MVPLAKLKTRAGSKPRSKASNASRVVETLLATRSALCVPSLGRQQRLQVGREALATEEMCVTERCAEPFLGHLREELPDEAAWHGRVHHHCPSRSRARRSPVSNRGGMKTDGTGRFS
eukprot:scaffold3337_cov67-Phaeocystis_antarctica.AAC.2